jgi:hypothetical protein
MCGILIFYLAIKIQAIQPVSVHVKNNEIRLVGQTKLIRLLRVIDERYLVIIVF